ncbi:MAG: phosphatase PAP2 family protein [Flavobacteriales bacterium]
MLLKPLKQIIVASIIGWVLLIGYSRIYLGVHYPLDVLVGFLYGAAAGLLMFAVYSKLEKKTEHA